MSPTLLDDAISAADASPDAPSLDHVLAREGNRSRIAHYQQLVRSLMREFVQTERAAQLHCIKEADRLGAHGPAPTLRAIAAHAVSAMPEIDELVQQLEVPASRAGDLMGRALSFARSLIIDRAAGHERSFRGTLLGVRHGVDLVRMLGEVSDHAGLPGVRAMCHRWLATRQPLVDDLADGLCWFAEHPGVATTSIWALRNAGKAPSAPSRDHN